MKGKGGCGSEQFSEAHEGKGEKEKDVSSAFRCVFCNFAGDESNR